MFKRRTVFRATILLTLVFASATVSAQQATPATQVGDTVTHPVTGVDATVVAVLPNYAVLTSDNNIILIFVSTGDVFTPSGSMTSVTVQSVTINTSTGLIDTIVIDPNDPDNPPDPPAALITMSVARNVDQEVADAIAAAAGAAGDPGGDLQVTIPAGNSNVFARRRVGASGGNGSDGYGLEICDPTGIFGCTIIGHSGSDGGAGNAPSAMIYNVGGDIESISNGLHGIQVVSIGGNGGQGGDAFGNINGRRGGNAGAGGTVNVAANANISTSGAEAHGIFAQSRSGRSGNGGSGFIFGGGGDGGSASSGGPVSVTNNGTISTLGNGSHGMYALSVGGAAGSGGDSWGLVGAGGSSRSGGNGGTASVANNGSIVTAGVNSHGMLAQSVGGTGGNGGDAGGVVAFGGSGSAGGNGRAAVANNGASAQVVTTGDRSIAVFAQSIGGGGGDGGISGGVVAFGGTGSAGGSGGAVTVTNAAGSRITTAGSAAHGVLAQSIGGGGGNGATSGGLVALGGSGSAAGNGGVVRIISSADVTTSGSDSRGLFAQSIGGGGGSANGTGGLVSLGGRGGSGGVGGSISVRNFGTIVTQSSGSDAIFAQSVGGGGGSGAASGGAVSIGGSGSGGGSASAVLVINDGTLATGDDFSRGIFAQSIGGGGGSGGASGGLVAIGGSGSQASNAGAVDVTNNGSIATGGVNSSAIQAQSIGGGGGDGGTTGGVFLTMGGRGGGGGSANAVTVESNRNLITTGSDSNGIFAQSVGGGGGNGGNTASGSLFAGAAIGGGGGNGGNGATVNVNTNQYDIDLGSGPVTLDPLIQTTGDRSTGILAQSIGGGGGNGGFAVQGTVGTFVSASVAIGGSGGNGGAGGAVNVNSEAAILTTGENADGIVAQSIGGGGGNGGFAISGSIQGNPAGGGAVSVGVGGSGGGGGSSGNVNANFTGSIQTGGDMSEGFIAQSIGGGGGNGGFSIAGSLSIGGVGSGAISVGVGGSGGAGGNGGAVAASSDGTVLTQGSDSTAVLFQSVGGGGGNGGYNISASLSGAGIGSGAVNVGVGGSGAGGGGGGVVVGSVTGIVATGGDRSTGVNIQSIGGGGGNGGFDIGLAASGAGAGTGGVNVGLGGSAAAASDAGRVTASIAADVSTAGDAANAILVQSVGGGGGNAGFNITGAGSAGGPGAAVNVAIGGGGGGGGDGGAVTATLSGNMQTMGDASNGILVQSVGGGGGNAQTNLGLAFGISGVGVSFGLGGAAGDAGNGDDVSVSHVGDITTNGFDSSGIQAQSVGGGGGNTSFNIASGYSSLAKIDVAIGRVGGIGGSAGRVNLATDGTITTLGDSSIGVLAQSVGNGGGKSGAHSFGASGSVGGAGVALGLSLGLEGGQGGTADNVDVTTRGRVQTAGRDAHAIFAQSVGGGGGIGGLSLLPVLLSSTVGASIGGIGGTGGTSGIVTVTNFAELLTLGNESNGIFAQSIGGGGGNGGIAVSGGIQTGPIGATLTMGGTGGTGAVSGDVNVTNSGIIDTHGLRSNGVYAQSLGGGGGNGGLTVNGVLSVGATPGMNMGIVIGGDGGTGATAGNTRVSNSGIIATSGDESNGIFAQSLGGGGGNGGLTANLQINRASGGAQVGVTIGGSGGSGGTGGNVTVDNVTPADGSMGGIIFTSGRESHGIFAQSIGGGGGNGSSTLAMNGTGGSGNLQVGVTLGGNGGMGGTGGLVTVNNDGMIETQGEGSHGIYAQSIGGGGGNGGLSIAANVVLGPPSGSFTPLFVMGGFGGDGNGGGNVVVNNSGNILTSGDASHGIVAQSIGGGGGDGALSIGIATSPDPLTQGLALAGPLFSALGGTGGDGGLGGDVTVNHSGDITTLGNGSEAIVAQSINGGGGGMRLDFSGVTNIGDQLVGGGVPDFTGTRWENAENGNGGPLMRYDLGAFEMQNANAGTVTVNTTGTFNTLGRDSIGQSVQAIGGGGGVLQWRAELSSNPLATGALPLLIQLGGTNGQQNNGGDITTVHQGNTLSIEAGSHGALLQSIGGGGGRGIVELDLGAGRDAELTFLLGGIGGSNESGGSITYSRNGNLVTLGDQAIGTAVQSIGGGGGIVTARVNSADDQTEVTQTTITLGALSGLMLDGGSLNLTFSGDLMTQGQQAHGLFLQSIGAGGGLLQFSGASSAIDVSLGSSGGASGNGGALDIVNTGSIWTEGDMANGVFLQSVGGGGGAVFTDSTGNPLNITLNTAGIGSGGDIRFVQNGDISTTGNGAFGIFAQSLGGGGGVVNNQFTGTAGGTGSGGAIDLQVEGNVMAIADGATAIFAQSNGADGAGDITISLLGSNSVVAGVGGTAISISGGNNNVIMNNGLIGTLDGVEGVAIATDAGAANGNETLFNFGSMFGSVLFGSGDNFFRNEVDALFLSGSNVQLDIERTGANAVGALINFGTLLPGGMNRIMETVVEGRFIQTDSGTLMADLDLSRTSEGPQADRLTISGSALLAGTIDINMSNAGFVLPGQHRDTIFAAEGGYGAYEGMLTSTSALGTIGTRPDLLLTGIPTSAVASFDIVFQNGTDVILSSNIDFAPDGMNRNQSALGEHVNDIQLAGGTSDFAPVANALFFTETLGELKDTYNMLSPEPYADALSHVLMSSTQFGEALVNCRNRRGDASLLDEGQCRWVRLAHHELDRDATASSMAFEQESIEISAGAQYDIGNEQHVGFGVSFIRGESKNGTLAAGDSDLYQIGVVHKQRGGRFALTSSLAAGYGTFDMARRVDLPSISGIAKSSPKLDFASGHVRFSYDRGGDRWYARLNIDGGVNYVHAKSTSESGAAAVSLDLASMHDTFLSIHPSVELGGEIPSAGLIRLRPYGRVGVLHIVGEGAEPELSATFSGAPDNLSPFTVESGMDKSYGDFAVGFDLLWARDSLLRIEGNGLIGSNTDALGIAASWSFAF